jgi:hypothetical protein
MVAAEPYESTIVTSWCPARISALTLAERWLDRVILTGMTTLQQVNVWVEAEAFLDSLTDADIAWVPFRG